MKKIVLALLMAATIPAFANNVTRSPYSDFLGTYDTADGTTITVEVAGNSLQVRINNGERVRLVPAGNGTFVAKNGKFKLEFEQSLGDDAARVVVVPISGA
jgi:hypothetical protein